MDARPDMATLLVAANLPPVGLLELHELFAAVLVVPTLPGGGIVRDIRIRDFVQRQEAPISRLRCGVRILGQKSNWGPSAFAARV